MAFSTRSNNFVSEDIMAKLRVPIGPDDHTQGPADAPVTLVEYGDYECPHCGHAYPIVKALQEKFGKRLRFVFRNFPLREVHPHAEAAAETAEFAGEHRKFWEMHDLIFENQSTLNERRLEELAQRLGLDVTALQDSLRSGAFAERVARDFSGGVRTPTFFINGARHDDSVEFETLAAAIEEAARGK
jgi:protein-disulfide isomerase